MISDDIKQHVSAAEAALRAIRKVAREAKEAPGEEKALLLRLHRAEKAKIAYRLSTQGVTYDVIGRAFGVDFRKAQKLSVDGEILCHGGKTREERVKEMEAGNLELWESGLFSNRVSNSLQRARIHTLDDLTEKTLQDLAGIPGLGTASIKEIEDVLAEIGKGLAG